MSDKSPKPLSELIFRPGSALGDLARHLHELIGGLAARGEHRDHALALLASGDDARGRALDLLGARHRGAAELHHHQVGVALPGRLCRVRCHGG